MARPEFIFDSKERKARADLERIEVMEKREGEVKGRQKETNQREGKSKERNRKG